MGSLMSWNIGILVAAGFLALTNGRTLSSCDFDGFRNDVCDWTHQPGLFQWTWSNTTTPSLFTGPRGDMSQTGAKGYLFVEASFPRDPNDACRLRSPLLEVEQGSDICLTMYSHMMGEEMGAIQVAVAFEDNGPFRTVYERRGDYDNFWRPLKLTFKANGTRTQIDIVGVVGTGAYGDAAIDDVVVSTCIPDESYISVPDLSAPFVEHPSTSNFASLPFECSFQTNRCGFSQAVDDDFDWLRRYGPTDTEMTGPQNGHTTGGPNDYYMLIESSEPQMPGDRAALLSPRFLLDNNTKGLCLQFFYHMFGSGMGTLRVLQQPYIGDRPNSSFAVWEATGNQGDRWRLLQWHMDSTADSVQLIFEATLVSQGDFFRSDIAIDDVSIVACNSSYVFPDIVNPPSRYPDGCSQPASLRNSTGQIATDENYPNGQYASEARCRWIIDAEDATKVLTLQYDESFWVESSERCEYDYVRVFNNLTDQQIASFSPCSETSLPFKGPYCGSYAPGDYTTSSSRVVVEFCSDDRGNRAGFRLTWNETEPITQPSAGGNCSQLHSVSAGVNAEISMMSEVKYENNQICEITIRNTDGLGIRLNAGSFDLENSTGCVHDYVAVHEHCIQRITRFCGNLGPVQHRSPCSEISVRFVTDSSDTAKGFQLHAEGLACISENHVSCSSLRRPSPKDTSSSTCIEETRVCDGNMDCEDGSDESDEACNRLFGCGMEDVAGEVGGLPVSFEDQPQTIHSWHVAIFARSRRLACSGTLIDKRWILTSAQCVNRFRYVDDMIIQLDAPVVDYAVYPERVEVVPEKIVFHPRFSVGEIRNDLALVKFTPPPALLTKRVPVCLSSQDDSFLETDTTTTLAAVYSFVPRLGTENMTTKPELPGAIRGRLNLEPDRNESIVSTPKRVRLLHSSFCRVGGQHNPVPDETLCGEPVLCAVYGDLGAPLVARMGGRHRLVGIYSYSRTECRPDWNGVSQFSPAVFTRIKFYYSWITGVLSRP
ncbi:hypothetical protein RvY_08797 [Ramazzottius varieornatus]|uniref:Uncharacterized protein n=1 Tax=Ramazzottius varieornatus TaxID=947166 RepID=A0A1D1V9Q3_RAMVA|nr:hypothetical protein RvY_08797 [Ramazzottius varieornatus]